MDFSKVSYVKFKFGNWMKIQKMNWHLWNIYFNTDPEKCAKWRQTCDSFFMQQLQIATFVCTFVWHFAICMHKKILPSLNVILELAFLLCVFAYDILALSQTKHLTHFTYDNFCMHTRQIPLGGCQRGLNRSFKQGFEPATLDLTDVKSNC